MKKIIATLLCLSMVVGIGGCGKEKEWPKPRTNPEVGEVLNEKFKFSFTLEDEIVNDEYVRMVSNTNYDSLKISSTIDVYSPEDRNPATTSITMNFENGKGEMFQTIKKDEIQPSVIKINKCTLNVVAENEITKSDIEDNVCTDSEISRGELLNEKINTLLKKLEMDQSQIFNYIAWYSESNIQELKKVYEEKKKKEEEDKAKKEEQQKTDKKSFLESCKTYGYKDIFRNAEDYQGKSAKFTGKVVQVMEAKGGIVLRVNVTKDDYGYYDDAVYAIWFDEDKENDPDALKRVLKDDIITMYGTLEGTKTYETTSGASVTIPEFYAKYIKLEK